MIFTILLYSSFLIILEYLKMKKQKLVAKKYLIFSFGQKDKQQ